jgi:hypothetical protein
MGKKESGEESFAWQSGPVEEPGTTEARKRSSSNSAAAEDYLSEDAAGHETREQRDRGGMTGGQERDETTRGQDRGGMDEQEQPSRNKSRGEMSGGQERGGMTGGQDRG